VNSSVGGSPIEAWLSGEALTHDPAFAVVTERWKRVLAAADPVKVRTYENELAAWHEAVARAAKANDGSVPSARPLAPAGPGHFAAPAGLFHGMIAPLAPYAVRGILWYQGESNAGRVGEYRKLFPALISDWRAAFRQGEIPFYWVQLPNFLPKDPTGMTWAELRDAQAEALKLSATGQAITIDIGSPENGHPYNKQDVGNRLALIALAKTYGHAVDHSGPRVRRVETVAGGLRIAFSDAEAGLRAKGALVGFELAGADEVFVPAEARIEGDAVIVSTSAVRAPAFVRYAWTNNPTACLFDQGGLPAGPFRVAVGMSVQP
jgi:sialate O-acetylesterase